MITNNQKLHERLSKIWEKPDFVSFFEKVVKKKPHFVKKGTVLFNYGDETGKLFFIKDGFVKMYRLSEDGRETIIYLYGPGNMLGVRALTSSDEAYSHTAEALTDMQIIAISRKEYLEILASNPEYIIDLLHIFISRLNYTERRLEGFITTDTTTRVANFLSDIARRFCKKDFYAKTNKKITLPVKLTHQRISEFVGSVRETVTEAMAKLEKEKILETKNGKITILNLKKLDDYASIHKKK